MRPFKQTISIEEARKRLAQHVRPIDRVERVRLADASGRVAASDITASIAVPPFARSAMDGYAVVAADTAGASPGLPVRLHIIERIYTGQTPARRISRGTCAEIATGAPLPPGADAVVMVERTETIGEQDVGILDGALAGQNVGASGADIAPGDLVVKRGDWLNPSRIGAIAAIGATEIDVYGRPRVAVLSTGNEVAEPGASLRSGQIYDVNRFTLGAVVATHGGIADLGGPVRDTIDEQTAALDRCGEADVIIFSGEAQSANEIS